jgi:hypothetical protein
MIYADLYFGLIQGKGSAFGVGRDRAAAMRARVISSFYGSFAFFSLC